MHHLLETFFDTILIRATSPQLTSTEGYFYFISSIGKPACIAISNVDFGWRMLIFWGNDTDFISMVLFYLHRKRKTTMTEYSKQTSLSWAVFKNYVCMHSVLKEMMKSHDISVHKVLVNQYLPCNLKWKEKLYLVHIQYMTRTSKPRNIKYFYNYKPLPTKTRPYANKFCPNKDKNVGL